MSVRASRFMVELVERPIHGPDGRIARIRGRLGLRQVDFAEELRKYGGRAGRETVSHWENLNAEGRPRALMTRRNARALVALAISHGLPLTEELVLEREEKPWETLARLQGTTAAQLNKLEAALAELETAVEARLSDGASGDLCVMGEPPFRIIYRSIGGVVERVWAEP
jgi:transcriptional regulator with XRE-family HTH domain